MNRRPPHPREPLRTARRGRRERNRRKPDLLNLARLLLGLVLVAQCLRVAFTSPRLQLREVRVAGSLRLDPAEATRLGRVQLGENIFRVNLVRVSERLRNNPAVEDAVVTRDLPGTLNVELRERVPALTIRAADTGRLFDADPEGVVFQEVLFPIEELPVLQLPARMVPALGRKLEDGLVRMVSECGRLSRQEQITVRNLRVDAAGELWLDIGTFSASQGPGRDLAVRVGRSTELPEKFRDIRQALLGWPDLPQMATYLNVMCAGSPAYRKASEHPASP